MRLTVYPKMLYPALYSGSSWTMISSAYGFFWMWFVTKRYWDFFKRLIVYSFCPVEGLLYCVSGKILLSSQWIIRLYVMLCCRLLSAHLWCKYHMFSPVLVVRCQYLLSILSLDRWMSVLLLLYEDPLMSFSLVLLDISNYSEVVEI